jgi:hypothetical protein
MPNKAEGYFEFQMFSDVLRVREGDVIHIRTDGDKKESIYRRSLTPDGKRIDPLRGLYKKWEWAVTAEIFRALMEKGVLEETGTKEYTVKRRRPGDADTL